MLKPDATEKIMRRKTQVTIRQLTVIPAGVAKSAVVKPRAADSHIGIIRAIITHLVCVHAIVNVRELGIGIFRILRVLTIKPEPDILGIYNVTAGAVGTAALEKRIADCLAFLLFEKLFGFFETPVASAPKVLNLCFVFFFGKRLIQEIVLFITEVRGKKTVLATAEVIAEITLYTIEGVFEKCASIESATEI